MEGAGRRGNRISLAIRFLGLLKQPDSASYALELDEGDVVWSADFSDTPGAHRSTESLDSSKKGNDSTSSPVSSLRFFSSNSRRVHAFEQGRSGLSAALADEDRLFVQQRKTAVDQIRYAASNTLHPVSVGLSQTTSGSGRSGGFPIQFPQSAPVNVPAWAKANRRPPNLAEFFEEDEEKEEKLPPHEMVARELARSQLTASVLEGVGRTLKGRDLCKVRNAIFRKTGFVES